MQKNKTWVASQEALSFKSEARLGYAQFEDGGSARAIASFAIVPRRQSGGQSYTAASWGLIGALICDDDTTMLPRYRL